MLKWVVAAAGVMLAMPTAALAQDTAAGEEVFKKICAPCHKVEAGKNAVGPSLFGVVGRKAGTEAGYNYSPAMKAFGQTWTEELLNKYIEAPKTVVPGNKMPYAGLKDEIQRDDLVAYLATLK
jgi:cytochrome c2